MEEGITAEKQKIKEELEQLRYEFKVELPRRIAEARVYGDVRENAEYEAAKERQSTLQARAGQIHKRLADLSRIDVSAIPRDRAGLGSEVTVENLDTGEEVRYTLVIPEVADEAPHFVSIAAPVGQALLNRRIGDAVTVRIPRGTFELEVRRIVTASGDVLE